MRSRRRRREEFRTPPWAAILVALLLTGALAGPVLHPLAASTSPQAPAQVSTAP